MSTESTLQKLGLGEYESRALDKLITHHDMTAEEIAKYTEIPYTKVYHVLTSLEKQGLVKSTIERPKKYRPIDPEEIVDIIIERKKEDLKALDKEAKTGLKEMKKQFQDGEKYQGREKVWSLSNEKAVFDEIITFANKSKSKLMILADKYIWEEVTTLVPLQEAIMKAVNKNTKLYCIIPKSVNVEKFPKLMLEILSSQNMSTRIIDDKEIFHTLAIKDEDEIGFSFKDPKTQKVLSGMVMRDELLTKGTIDYFNRVWNSSIPAETALREEAKRALMKLNDKN